MVEGNDQKEIESEFNFQREKKFCFEVFSQLMIIFMRQSPLLLFN